MIVRTNSKYKWKGLDKAAKLEMADTYIYLFSKSQPETEKLTFTMSAKHFVCMWVFENSILRVGCTRTPHF